MILLDTNIISEPLKPAGNANVLAWIDAQTIAIATTHGYKIATRDTTSFEAAGLTVINPWIWQPH